MGVTLERVQFKFASIIGELCSEPDVLSQFAVWVDLRLAEYKLKGSISLDCSGETPDPVWMKGIVTALLKKGRCKTSETKSIHSSKEDKSKQHYHQKVREKHSGQKIIQKTVNINDKGGDVKFGDDHGFLVVVQNESDGMKTFSFSGSPAVESIDVVDGENELDTSSHQSLMSIIGGTLPETSEQAVEVVSGTSTDPQHSGKHPIAQPLSISPRRGPHVNSVLKPGNCNRLSGAVIVSADGPRQNACVIPGKQNGHQMKGPPTSTCSYMLTAAGQPLQSHNTFNGSRKRKRHADFEANNPKRIQEVFGLTVANSPKTSGDKLESEKQAAASGTPLQNLEHFVVSKSLPLLALDPTFRQALAPEMPPGSYLVARNIPSQPFNHNLQTRKPVQLLSKPPEVNTIEAVSHQTVPHQINTTHQARRHNIPLLCKPQDSTQSQQILTPQVLLSPPESKNLHAQSSTTTTSASQKDSFKKDASTQKRRTHVAMKYPMKRPPPHQVRFRHILPAGQPHPDISSTDSTTGTTKGSIDTSSNKSRTATCTNNNNNNNNNSTVINAEDSSTQDINTVISNTCTGENMNGSSIVVEIL